jgi:succinate-semialdehyde dehydrogenase/glutarate-semialdehyde dehydrogenase
MDIPTLMYINGEWIGASNYETSPLINPATEEIIAEIPIATSIDINYAINAAYNAWKQWRNVDAWTRSNILRKMAEWIKLNIKILARTLTEEQGKPIGEAIGEIKSTIDQFDWYADEARRIYGRTIESQNIEERLMVIKQPIGPVAAFSSWNSPVLVSARKIAPAIAAGCSIILKPDLEAPRSPLILGKASEEAGLPAGVLNIITGDPSQISKQLCSSNIIRKVSLTGSVPVGSIILKQCAETIKPTIMELGGHSPFIVFEDANVKEAAEIAARWKYRNNGQVCISPNRFFIQNSIFELFLKQFIEVTRNFKIGNGLDPSVEIGPLINKRRIESIEALIKDALEKGAKLELGGKRHEGFTKGYFFEPTVISNLNITMKIMHEEPFGPIAPIISFSNLDDVVEKANSTQFGLAAYIFTKDLETAFLASERIEVGMIGLNTVNMVAAEAPFGGIKFSGFGHEGGLEGIQEYTVEKLIKIKL